MVRPSLGHESEPEWGFYGFPKTEHPKKVWIIGAGIAGMQAAGIAAEKGHNVTVTEKNDRVGGQAATAANSAAVTDFILSRLPKNMPQRWSTTTNAGLSGSSVYTRTCGLPVRKVAFQSILRISSPGR